MTAVTPRPRAHFDAAEQLLLQVRTDDVTAGLRHCQAAEVLLIVAKSEPDPLTAVRWIGEAQAHAAIAQARATLALASSASEVRPASDAGPEDDLMAVFDALGLDANGTVRA